MVGLRVQVSQDDHYSNEGAAVSADSKESLENAAELLQVPAKELEKRLCTQTIKVSVRIPLVLLLEPAAIYWLSELIPPGNTFAGAWLKREL